MTKFANQDIGSFDDNTHEYVEVWFDAAVVKQFKFHSVGFRGVMNSYHRVHGISVDARYIFAATKGFSQVTNIMAVHPDGHEYFITWTQMQGGKDDGVEEFHMGDKYGKVIARMRRTGYVQNLASSLIEA